MISSRKVSEKSVDAFFFKQDLLLTPSHWDVGFGADNHVLGLTKFNFGPSKVIFASSKFPLKKPVRLSLRVPKMVFNS